MQDRLLPVLLGLLVACGGQSAGPAGPKDNATTPEAAVQSFMQAVADSNISRMGRFWGSNKGPAVVTNSPSDYQQRMVVTQIFLRGSPFTIVRTEEVPGDADRRIVVVDLDRTDSAGSRCTRTLPITVVKTQELGWIVTAMDVSLAGTPGRPCSSART